MRAASRAERAVLTDLWSHGGYLKRDCSSTQGILEHLEMTTNEKS